MWPLSISVAPSPDPAKRPTSPHASRRSTSMPGKSGSAANESRSICQWSTSRPPAARSSAIRACAWFSPSVPLTLGVRTTSAAVVRSSRSSSPTLSSTLIRAAVVMHATVGGERQRMRPGSRPPRHPRRWGRPYPKDTGAPHRTASRTERSMETWNPPRSLPHRRTTHRARSPPPDAVAAVKVYGRDGTEVRALDGVDVSIAGRPVHGHHGPVRFRQEHADALPRRPRHV